MDHGLSWEAIGIIISTVLTTGVPVFAWLVKIHNRLTELVGVIERLADKYDRMEMQVENHEGRLDALEKG